MATPSAPPSIGSVPEPTSSSSTSAGTARPRSIAAMLVMCAEKVLRLASIDCSSPMSAKTRSEHRQPRSVGRRNPQPRLRHQRQQSGRLERNRLAAGVRPGDQQQRRRRDDLDRDRHRAPSPADAAPPAARTRRRSTAPARRRRSTRKSARAPAARRARWPRRPSGCRSAARARNASVSASRMRRTSSASCSSSATMSLLISTVLSGSRNRLAPLVDAPCTMPGNRRCGARP